MKVYVNKSLISPSPSSMAMVGGLTDHLSGTVILSDPVVGGAPTTFWVL